jgi:probable rRNA maturation factor
MRIEIELNNIAGKRAKKTFFKSVLRRLEKILEEKYPYPDAVYGVSLAIVDEPEIRGLNRIYRHINKATDVLSFSEFSSRSKVMHSTEKLVFLGEVILCYDNIKRYSKSKGGDFESEVAKVFAHGVLHLFGFRHGKMMFSLQEEVSKKLKLTKNKKWTD